MNEPQKGDRVGVVRDSTRTHVFLYGFGVYEGDFPMGEEGAGDVADMVRQADAPTNPRIRLDSGEIVWGAECWWGPEEETRAGFGAREVVQVSITQDREEVRRREVDRAALVEKFVGKAREILRAAGVADSVGLTGDLQAFIRKDTGAKLIVVSAFVTFDESSGDLQLVPEGSR